jgi:hypothetical protein
MVPLRIHNIIDYFVGAFLIAVPWIIGVEEVSSARNVFLASGVSLIGYSLLTNYYFSVARIIPLGIHMTLDTILGIFLILAPALFGYREQLIETQYVEHVVTGVLLVGLVALTRPRTEASKTTLDRAAIQHQLPLNR